MGILPKESRVVLEEEDENDETMSEGEEGEDEGLCMDGEDEPPDDLRYNREGKKIVVLTGSMQKIVLKRAIAKEARSEVKSAIQLHSRIHRPSLST